MASTDAPRRQTYHVNLGLQDISASTPYVLVDLSDSSDFPHISTNWLNLLGLQINAEKNTDGVYDVWIGVVYENDSSNGSALWLHVFHLEAVGNPTDSTDRFAQSVDFTQGGGVPDGINCQVNDGGTGLNYFVGNQEQAGHGNWINSTNRVSPVGSTTKPAASDLVMWCEKVSGAGKLDVSVTVAYETH